MSQLLDQSPEGVVVARTLPLDWWLVAELAQASDDRPTQFGADRQVRRLQKCEYLVIGSERPRIGGKLLEQEPIALIQGEDSEESDSHVVIPLRSLHRLREQRLRPCDIALANRSLTHPT